MTLLSPPQKALAPLNPQMTFVYVSGRGTDSSEKGGSMWARVKGKTENDLLRLPFKAAYMFRPGSHSAAAWGARQGRRVPHSLYRNQAPPVPASSAVSQHEL